MGTGDFFWNSKLTNTQKVKLIRLAIKNEINFIDTAEEYGNGTSERIVGEATQDIRDKVFIASKISPQNHRYDDVLRSFEKGTQLSSKKCLVSLLCFKKFVYQYATSLGTFTLRSP